MNVHGISIPLLRVDAYRSSGILWLSLSKPFSLWVNNSLKSRGATHVQGGVCKRYTDNYKDQASKLEMENCLEADIHSY